ncbi:hypothetical protein CLV24_10529 [Pontibacter ummariensis]|uniref:Endonuclease/Exonuclease/phosphatase family protein n=1 Tax=Pontibacter ummariensis TaxID=1610492 RepID=A0A239E076_9BACT|nr:endonuclease/exonuclease/phosphatase family protein [Pontibacter ummariensis]PRY13659.1 hypothetical protein CLV24_10529 [Pontibacter ummariensis]SNS38115.1 Endonuclease/Exonuclease/phosphatase family protein [Pontibacter ummariensis]
MWIGDNRHKGLGIFAAEHLQIEPLDWSNVYKGHTESYSLPAQTVKYFLPCAVNKSIQLLGVWTHQNNSPTFGYIGQLWKYLQVNKQPLKKVLIAGDFNSNTIWDARDRWWNHSDVVRELQELEIESLYHKYFEEEQGKESKPTFFLHRKPQKPYHIDYVFGSRVFSRALTQLEIGNQEQWLKISDHLPLTCEFAAEERKLR